MRPECIPKHTKEGIGKNIVADYFLTDAGAPSCRCKRYEQ
jgi:hypothetical protein